MSRACSCSPRCRHLVEGDAEPLLPVERLLQLEAIVGTLLDAADAFDSDGLIFDINCEVHGDRPTSNPTCSCQGERASAVEFVKALELDLRSVSQPARRAPLSQDRRARWARKQRANLQLVASR